jgi:nitroreductase
MTFLELAQKRYSVRGYQNKPVDDALIAKVLEAGRIAPSACNLQPWYFIVVRDRGNIAALKETYKQEWFAAAPVVVAVCLDKEKCWKRRDGRIYGDVDIAIAVDHMTLQATELGLGTCWIGAFNVVEARKALQVPDNVEPLIFTPLGFPSTKPPAKSRKSLEEIVFWEKFGQKKAEA